MTTLCVVGGGWAGIAAAVHGVLRGFEVTLLEMAPQLGGRARRVEADGLELDSGQHILIGAYTATLDLMRAVGVDPQQVLLRRPLELVYPDGSGLRLRPGSPLPAFARAVLAAPGWSWSERLGLARAAASWALARFRCDPTLTVDRLVARLAPRVRAELVEPLCVAALNTPSDQASAAVFLRVMRDALFSGPGSADLLLPRCTLSELLPAPASQWLEAHGAEVRLGCRAGALERRGHAWHVDGHPFDRVVLACSASEAARLARHAQPQWAAMAAAFEYEPIVTVYLRSAGSRLPHPMVALRSDDERPAQFVFDLGALGGIPGVFAAVSSGASRWAERGAEVSGAATARQLKSAFAPATWQEEPQVIRVLTDKRATFRCVPQMSRPSPHVADGLQAAGDYIDGPYPATLEGAVRSGESAVRSFVGM
jgi:squalene-associated FAD-dependent desaturase